MTVSGISRTHTCLPLFRAVSRKVANALPPLPLLVEAYFLTRMFRDFKTPRPFQCLWNKFHKQRIRSGDAREREKRIDFYSDLSFMLISMSMSR